MGVMTASLLASTVFAAPAQGVSTTKQTLSAAPAAAIPDATPRIDGENGVTDSAIEVSGLEGSITSVSATMHVTHGDLSDLDTAIVGPDGQTFAYLFEKSALTGTGLGTGCADADRTGFDDAAGTSIEAGAAPYVGTYRPQDDLTIPLSTFNGNSAGSNGTWLLDIWDTDPGDTGTIECWSLFIETDAGQALRFDSTGAVAMEDAIPASGGPGVAESAVMASGLKGGVAEVTVSVWITHGRDADLDVILVAPDGQEVKLAARVGGDGADFGTSCSKATIFDPGAKTPIGQGTAPFVGKFRPSQSTAILGGSPANGEWRLRAVDNVGGNVGELRCWSLSITASTATNPSGLVVKPGLGAPAPLPGAYNYAYVGIKNTTPDPITGVTLTGILPDTLSDAREAPEVFPGAGCSLVGTQFTCSWSSIASGESVTGGVVAKVGDPKKGEVCLSGAVTADGIGQANATNCFNLSSYPAGDRGTGFDIGDIAHDLTLLDQDGNVVSLSQFAGSYVLLSLSASWCAPSNFEVPMDRDEIAALNASNAMGVPVVYLTILLDGPTPGEPSTQQNATNWASRFGLTSPVLSTANDANRSATQHHLSYSVVAGEPVPAVPTSIFIRPDGEIFGIRVGVEPEGSTTDRFLADLP